MTMNKLQQCSKEVKSMPPHPNLQVLPIHRLARHPFHRETAVNLGLGTVNPLTGVRC